MSLSRVCLIVDLDGFRVGGRFHAREMGFASLTDGSAGCYRFRLNHLVPTPGDWKTIRYCTDRIHGLSLRTAPGELDSLDEDFLETLLLIEYRRARTPEKYLVAFKGGHVERDVLRRLEIPHVNLEDFGCPKFEHLRHPMKSAVRDCGYHGGLKGKGAAAHCAKVECFFFAEWARDVLERE